MKKGASRYRYVVRDIRSGRQVSLMSEGGEEAEKEVVCLVVVVFVLYYIAGCMERCNQGPLISLEILTFR